MRDNVSYGSIIIPETCARHTEIAEVLHVGEAYTFVKPGDYIAFSRYNGTVLENDERLLTPAGVIGKLEMPA